MTAAAYPIATARPIKVPDPTTIAEVISIGHTMSLRDLCAAFGVSNEPSNHNRIRNIIPPANQGRAEAKINGTPVYLWRIVNCDTDTPQGTVRCIEVPFKAE